MLKVTNITKLKVKYKIELDNGKHFYVSENTIVKYALVNKVELTKEQLKNILAEESIESAFSRAIRYLGYGLRTEQDMRDYLEKKEIVPDVIDEVIVRLKEMNYIDDAHYIEAVVNDYFHINNKGPYFIKRKLLQKKLDAEFIDKSIKEICTREETIDMLYSIIEREYRVRRDSKNKKVQKITSKLYANGFSFDIIKEVFSIFFDDYQDEDDDLEILEEHFNKVYSNYSRKFDDTYTLKKKIIEKLVRDGFSYYDVKNFLETQDI